MSDINLARRCRTVQLLSAAALLTIGVSRPVQALDLRIGVITELSGAGAAIGVDCKDGAEVALGGLSQDGHVGSHTAKLVFGDSQDDAKVALAEFNRLTQKEGVGVVVVSRSKIAMPLNPLSKRAGVPIVGTVAHPDFTTGNPLSVRAYPNAEIEGAFLGERAFAMGKRRMAAITVEDEWNLATSRAFVEKFQQLGGAVLYDQSIEPAELDFSTHATAIKKVAPDSVFVNLQLAQGGSFIRKLRELGVSAQLFSNYWVQKPAVVDVAGVANVEGVVFGEVDSHRPKFLEAFGRLYPDKTASPGTYICYVAVGTALDALRATADGGSQEDFVQQLTAIPQVALLDDRIPFANREIRYDLKVRSLHEGKVVDLNPRAGNQEVTNAVGGV